MVDQCPAESIHQRSIDRSVALRQNLKPLFRRLTGIVLLCVTLALGTELALARLQAVPAILNLPQSYLPGERPPEDLECQIPSDPDAQWYEGFCEVNYQGKRVYLEFDADGRQILRSVIPGRGYSLGQLIVSWGRPSGIHWNQYTVYVYWETRWVILYHRALRPASQVDIILYTQEQPPASPWRGFVPKMD